MGRRTRIRSVAAAVALGMVLTGCASEDGEDQEPTGESASAPAVPTESARATAAPADSTASTATAAPAQVVLDEATRATLQRIFEDNFAASGMPGAAAYVSIGGEEWSSTAGVSDLETEEPYDADGTVRIASNTKTFTATAVLMLADEGQLSLDDTLEQYVPGITNGDRITIRHLLGMSSGIWDFTADEELVTRFDADPMIDWTVEDTVELVKGKPAEFEPGEKVQYCDANYVLLGVILEQVSGMEAAEFVNTRIVQPLGLANTRFPADDQPGVPEPHPTGYLPGPDGLGDLEQLQPVGDINPQFAWAAGNMTSSLADLAAWGEELAEGTLLSPETQRERLEGRRFDGQTINFGYGLGAIVLNDFVGHDGAIVGYSSVVMRYPDADATFAIVGNASTNFTTPTMDIFLAMVQELYPDQLR